MRGCLLCIIAAMYVGRCVIVKKKKKKNHALEGQQKVRSRNKTSFCKFHLKWLEDELRMVKDFKVFVKRTTNKILSLG